MTHAAALVKLQKWADRNGGQVALADRLGCSKSFVSYLLSGERLPGRRVAARLKSDFRIPLETWDQAA